MLVRIVNLLDDQLLKFICGLCHFCVRVEGSGYWIFLYKMCVNFFGYEVNI